MTYRYGQKGYTDSSSGIWTPYGDEESNADAVVEAIDQLIPIAQQLELSAESIDQLWVEPYSASDVGHVPEQREAVVHLVAAAHAARQARATLNRMQRLYTPADQIHLEDNA